MSAPEWTGVFCDDPAERVGEDYDEPERWLSPLENLPDQADGLGR